MKDENQALHPAVKCLAILFVFIFFLSVIHILLVSKVELSQWSNFILMTSFSISAILICYSMLMLNAALLSGNKSKVLNKLIDGII